jgi:hypothetical protein
MEVRKSIFSVDPAFGHRNCVKVCSVADVSEEHTAVIFKVEVLMMGAACSSETSATRPNSTRRQHLKAGSTLKMYHRESLKSVKPIFSK